VTGGIEDPTILIAVGEKSAAMAEKPA